MLRRPIRFHGNTLYHKVSFWQVVFDPVFTSYEKCSTLCSTSWHPESPFRTGGQAV
jgi:hypothetical protein